MRIPGQDNKFFVSNGSDLIPNIQFTKNVDLDKYGYIKLSAPFPSILNSKVNTDYDILGDIIYLGDYEYVLSTDNKILHLDLDTLGFSANASYPRGDVRSRFVGWQNGDWYYGRSDLYAFDGTAFTSVNGDGVDYIETFPSRNTLVGEWADGKFYQYASNFSRTGPNLIIPDNFYCTGISYSNYRLGISTADDAIRQAFFFAWDGTNTSAQVGVPVNAPWILDSAAYKDSWVVVTSKGQILYFNGSGFDTLANLAPYYTPDNWIDVSTAHYHAHGRTIYVDGDVIYHNVGSNMSASRDDTGILPGFWSGIYCYDQDVGLYHRYGLSGSFLRREALTPTAGVFTATSAHYLESGDKVIADGGTKYYAIKIDGTTFKLANTYDLAIAGTADSSIVSGAKTLFWIARTDWSQTGYYSGNVGAVIKFDNAMTAANGYVPFFAGAYMSNVSLSAALNSLNVAAPKFDNIGSVTYYKIKSQTKEDIVKAVTVKTSKLKDSDKIIVKYKGKEPYTAMAIGEADDMTPDRFITWTNDTTFTFPSTYLDASSVSAGDEVELVAGAGAGSTAHISTITLATGTYTVVLDEAIRGVAAGNKSTCVFDCFKKAAVITKDTQTNTPNTYTTRLFSNISKTFQLKLEIRGNDVVIEDVDIDNTPQK